MNAATFFVKHFGVKVWPDLELTGDDVTDTRTMLGTAAKLQTGASLRMQQCWAVITPAWTQTSFKVQDRPSILATLSMREAVLSASQTNDPFLWLSLGMKSTTVEDFYLTADKRAVRKCMQGEVQTINILEDAKWT